MRYIKYLALVSVLMVPLAYSQAQVSVGVGFGPGYVGGPPACEYGYYGYAPYACAPYGYYGPDWFYGGVFIGAGPWFHGFRGGYWGRGGFGGRGFAGRGFEGRGAGFAARGGFARGAAVGRGSVGGGFR